jgi:hypothetical protein
MSGVRGRSGRRKGSGMTAAQHALRGTYQRSRHGPLPVGVEPLQPSARVLAMPNRPTITAPPPADLDQVEAAKWAELAARCPSLAAEHPDELRLYVSTWADWVDARTKLRAHGGSLLKGPNNGLMQSPFVALAYKALRALREMQTSPLFAGTRESKAIGREKSRLEKFLAANGR